MGIENDIFPHSNVSTWNPKYIYLGLISFGIVSAVSLVALFISIIALYKANLSNTRQLCQPKKVKITTVPYDNKQ